MTGALAAQLEVPDQRGIEEHHRLGGERSVLRGAEGQHIDARAPGDVRGMAAEEGDRVREARAVHVHLEPALMGDCAELGEWLATVTRAELGGLGDRQRGRLHLVNVARGVGAERRPEGRGLEPAMLAGEERELRSAREESRGAALVDRDMRLLVREDRSIGRTQGGEAQGVGRGAGRDRERARFGTEERAEGAVEARGPLVLPVRLGESTVGALEGGEDLGAGGGGVVAEKTQALAPRGSVRGGARSQVCRSAQSMRQRNDQAPNARNASAVAPR